MADQTINLNQTQAKLLVKELDSIERIRKVLLDVIPESYLKPGSDLWWAKSIKEGKEDIEKGKYTVVKNKKELQNHLDSLKK